MIIYNYTNLDISYNNNSFVKINNKTYYCDYKKPTIDLLVNLCNDYYNNFDFKNEFKIFLTGSFLSKSHNLARNIDILITNNNSFSKDYNKIYDCLYFITNNALEKYNLIIKPEYYENIDNIDNHYLNLYNAYDMSSNSNTISNIIIIFKSYGENLTYINYIERRSNEDSDSDLFIIPNYNINLDLSYHIIKNNNFDKTLYSLNFDASFINYNFSYFFKDIRKLNDDLTYSYNEHYFTPILLFDGNNYNNNIFDYSNNTLVYNTNYNYN